MEEGSCVTQLIDGNGKFNAVGLDKFVKKVKLSECGVSYAVVAVMGPQSSGKSTLMNHLFRTDFREMNAEDGRNQTTKGIWMAKCVGIEPCTIAMDLEGSDGRERGQDDTIFEKQSALFALAISDFLLINMWCQEIGREQAANKPLLRTIFQAMMRLFVPGRKTVLLFVLRDKTETPLEKLKCTVFEDLHKIWDEILKPQDHINTRLEDIFKVKVVAMSHYVYEKVKFKEEVATLRESFFNSTSPGGLAGDRQNVVAASGFSFSANNIWKQIKENKDLDLPSHKVMVANVRCDEIANDKFNQLISSEDWLKLKEAVKIGPVKGFGGRLSLILETCFSGYEKEAMYFDEGVKKRRRDLLEKIAFDAVYPAYIAMVEHIRSSAFEHFKGSLQQSINKGEDLIIAARVCTQSSIAEFDQGLADAAIEQAVNWDLASIRDRLRSDMEAHTYSLYQDWIVTKLERLDIKDKDNAVRYMDKMLELYNNEMEREDAQRYMDKMLELYNKELEMEIMKKQKSSKSSCVIS